MKKLYVIILLITFALNENHCQDYNPFSSGHLLLGGTINMDGKKIERQMLGTSVYVINHEKNIGANFNLGYFAYNNTVAGVKVDLLFNRFKFESGEVNHTDILLVEPFIRYYAPFGVFAEAAVGYGFYKFGLGTTSGDDQVKNAWSLGIGYSLFIKENIAIETILSYDVLKNTEKVDDQVEKYSGLSVNIGVQVYLNLARTKPLKQ